MQSLRSKRLPPAEADNSWNRIYESQGYFKENGTKTAEDIMADVLKAELEAGLLDEDE